MRSRKRLIIALVVAWSAWYASRRLLPTASRRAQARIATWLEDPAHSAWLRRIGHAMQPVQTAVRRLRHERLLELRRVRAVDAPRHRSMRSRSSFQCRARNP